MPVDIDFATSRYPFRHVGPTAQVTPFTLRDGASFLEKLERLSYFVDETLRGEVRAFFERVVEEFNTSMDETGTKWTTEFTAYMTDVNESLMALNDTAMGTLVNIPSSETATAIRELIDDLSASDADLTALDERVTEKLDATVAQLETELADQKTAVDNAISTMRTEVNADLDEVRSDVAEELSTLNSLVVFPMREWVRAGLRQSPFSPFRILFAGDSHTNDGSLERPTQQPEMWGGGTGYAYRVGNLLTNAGLGEAQAGVNAVTKSFPGIHVWESATGGMRSDNYMAQGTVANIANIKPHLVTHFIGTNDFALQVPVATFKSNVRNAIAAVWNVSPDTRQLLIIPWPRENPNGMNAQWREYVDAMRQVAAEQGTNEKFELMDYGAKYERFSSPLNAKLWGIFPDGVHGDRNAHRDLAEDLAAWLGLPSPMAVFGPTKVIRGSDIRGGTLDNSNPHSSLTIEAAAVPRYAVFHINLLSVSTGETDIVINELTDQTVGFIGTLYPFHVQAHALATDHFTKRLFIPAHSNRYYYLSGGVDVNVYGAPQYNEYNDFFVELSYA